MKNTYKFIASAIAILILVVIINPILLVDSQERGVVATWGKVSDNVLQPGLHFRWPLAQSVAKYAVVPQQLDFTIPVDNAGATTKDNQTLGAETTLFYRFDENKLLDIRKNWGQAKLEAQMGKIIQESFKNVIGGYSIFEVSLSQKEIQGKTWTVISEKTKDLPISLVSLNITNYDWDEQFNKQIEETMKKAQQARQAAQELEITKQQVQKDVAKAEADAKVTVTRAQAQKDAAQLSADAKAIEGEGLKKYNESVAANLDVQVRLKELDNERARIDKWNGAYIANNNYLPIPFNYGTVQGQ
jgi:regulator of protease activity HflC (stomatin/prohibitin superfamily)